MKINVSNSEIDKLERVLTDFKLEWEVLQSDKASKWRHYFFISITITLVLPTLFPSFWWASIVVIGYFAGSLFSLLRLNAKTNSQIIEHQKQLKLIRLLRNFESLPK